MEKGISHDEIVNVIKSLNGYKFIIAHVFWGIICLSLAFVWNLYTIGLLVSLHESVLDTRYSRYLQLSIAAFAWENICSFSGDVSFRRHMRAIHNHMGSNNETILSTILLEKAPDVATDKANEKAPDVVTYILVFVSSFLLYLNI